jgi:RNA polymerase sigma factor (sigma-70 family)
MAPARHIDSLQPSPEWLADLARRAAGGDGPARLELWARVVYPLGRKLAARYAPQLGPGALEAALTHVFFHTLLERVDTLRDPEAFVPWITRSLRNALKSALRREPPFADLDSAALPESPDPGPSPEASVLGSERDRLIHDLALFIGAAIETLPPDEREMVLLKAGEHLTYREMAQRLGSPDESVDTVRDRLKKRTPRLIARVAQRATRLAAAAGRMDVVEYLRLDDWA